MRRLAAAGIALVLALLAVHPPAGQGSGQPARRSTPPRPVSLNRIAVLVLENRSYENVFGNPAAPYLNRLARSGALATRYFAVTHPSLPNYVALTTGGHKTVNSDCAACRASGRSLAGQLEAAGISWRAYFESMRDRLSTQWASGAAYNPHYNPFAYT